MAFRDIFRVSRKTFINPTAWIDYDSLKQQTILITDTVKPLFARPTPGRKETFEQAIERFNLREKDIKAMTTDYQVYAGVLFLLGLVSVGYCFYLLLHHVAFIAFLMGLAVSTLFFAQAFRYDFWAMQLTKRKLGCTMREWKAYRFGSKRKP